MSGEHTDPARRLAKQIHGVAKQHAEGSTSGRSILGEVATQSPISIRPMSSTHPIADENLLWSNTALLTRDQWNVGDTVVMDRVGSLYVIGDILNTGTLLGGTGGGTSSPLLQVTTVNTNTTIAATDRVVLVTGSVTVKLPSLSSSGEVHEIKDRIGTAQASPITLDGNGNTIDGASTYIINNDFEAVRVISDGTNWSIT